MIRKCKQCGKTFELTDKEIAFFNSKGLDLPKRCQTCRNKNRKARISEPPAMPGIQQVREVDPGFHRSAPAPSYEKQRREPERQTEETVPFWKQEQPKEKKSHPVIAVVIILVILFGGITGGVVYAIRQVGTKAEQQNMPVTEAPQVTYYLNTYRKKFHRPDCASVYEMDPENRQAFYGTREEAIEKGYSPCHNCNP